jgi:hypothetical protein
VQDIPDGRLISVPFRPPLRRHFADFGPQPSEASLRGDVRDAWPIGGGLRGDVRDSRPIGGGGLRGDVRDSRPIVGGLRGDARDSRPIGGGLRGDVIDFSGGRGPAAEMTSSPQSLADSALGAEGDFSTSPDQKEFRWERTKTEVFFWSTVSSFLILWTSHGK